MRAERCEVGPWRWALIDDDRLSATDRHVALTLAVRMNGDGSIPDRFAPGVRLIASDARRKTDTVVGALDRLAELGYLAVTEGGNGRRNTYRATRPVPSTGYATVPPTGDAYPSAPSPLESKPSPLEAETVPPTGDTTSTTSMTSSCATCSGRGETVQLADTASQHRPAGPVLVPCPDCSEAA